MRKGLQTAVVRFAPLAVMGKNQNAQPVNMIFRLCDVLECEYVQTAVRDGKQLCGHHARLWDIEHGRMK